MTNKVDDTSVKIKNKKRRRIVKGIYSGLLVVTFLSVVCYLLLVFYYKDGFFYNTWINGVYCTGKTIDEVDAELSKQIQYDGLTIFSEDGKSYCVFPRDISLDINYKEALEIYLKQQNPFLWIDYFLHDNSNQTLDPVVSFDEEKLQTVLDGFDFWNTKKDEQRTVKLEKTEKGYVLINERDMVLNNQKTKELIVVTIKSLEPSLNLSESGCYEQLALSPSMEDDIRIFKKINDFQQTHIEYEFGEDRVILDASFLCNMMLQTDEGAFVLDDEGKIKADENKIREFVDELGDRFDTLNKKRLFHTTDGREIELSTGTYGNLIDREAEVSYLINAISERRIENRKPVYLQEAWLFGEDDIGGTYIEIDMGNQHMYYYIDGELYVETDIVTGNMALKRDTPDGVYYIYYKQRDRTLRGPGYASFVNYWMAVYKGVGIHDSSWRSEYGGDIYQTDGSHGCINTPKDIVAMIYEKAEIGTPVIMFY